MSGWVLDKAVVRYGYKEYDITCIPKTFNLSLVKRQIRSRFPGDRRSNNLQVTEMPAYPDFNIPATLCVHFPDWAVEVRYIKE